MNSKNISGTSSAVNIYNGNINSLDWLTIAGSTVTATGNLFGPNGLDVIAELNNKMDIIDGTTALTVASLDIDNASGTNILYFDGGLQASITCTTGVLTFDIATVEKFSLNSTDATFAVDVTTPTLTSPLIESSGTTQTFNVNGVQLMKLNQGNMKAIFGTTEITADDATITNFNCTTSIVGTGNIYTVESTNCNVDDTLNATISILPDLTCNTTFTCGATATMSGLVNITGDFFNITGARNLTETSYGIYGGHSQGIFSDAYSLNFVSDAAYSSVINFSTAVTANVADISCDNVNNLLLFGIGGSVDLTISSTTVTCAQNLTVDGDFLVSGSHTTDAITSSTSTLTLANNTGIKCTINNNGLDLGSSILTTTGEISTTNYMTVGNTTADNALSVYGNGASSYTNSSNAGFHTGLDSSSNTVMSLNASSTGVKSSIIGFVDTVTSSMVGRILYNFDNDDMTFRTNNVDALTIDSSQNVEILTGTLRIGEPTTDTLEEVVVNGSIKVTDKLIIARDNALAAATLREWSFDNVGNLLKLYWDQTGTPVEVWSVHTTGALIMAAGADLIVDTDTFFVDASTNRVGIGTLTPNSALHIVGSRDNDPNEIGVHFGQSSSNYGIELCSSTSNDSSLEFTTPAFGKRAAITYDHDGDTNNNMQFYVNGNANNSGNLIKLSKNDDIEMFGDVSIDGTLTAKGMMLSFLGEQSSYTAWGTGDEIFTYGNGQISDASKYFGIPTPGADFTFKRWAYTRMNWTSGPSTSTRTVLDVTVNNVVVCYVYMDWSRAEAHVTNGTIHGQYSSSATSYTPVDYAFTSSGEVIILFIV